MDISINQLFDTKRARLYKRIEMFQRILGKCHRKIKAAARHEHVDCVYAIPCIIVGMPMYKLDECKEYLASSLTHNGFEVHAVPSQPDHIFISWRHHDVT
jgi:hypothetical protein